MPASFQLKSLFPRLARLGADPADSEDLRLRKARLARSSVLFIGAGAGWGLIYFSLGQWLPGAIPMAYAVISLVSVILFGITRQYRPFCYSQLSLILLLPFLLMLVLGGFIDSSAVILWSLISPLGALLFDEPRRAPRWFLAYAALVVLSGLLQPYLDPAAVLPSAWIILFFVLNLVGPSLIAFALLHAFVLERERALGLLRTEKERSEGLLLNILPREIAAILKKGNRTIADHFDGASVLFADMVGFTPLTAEMDPRELVGLLNEIFSAFDALVDKYGLEKIRTIGDSYMVASGVPRSRPDHAQALARMALDMRAYVHRDPACASRNLDFRIGINSGPVVAGVIGRKKFAYDLWGDAVNLASRMESHGTPGKIQISRATYELIKDEFVCSPRGEVLVKGKGQMSTWYLEAARQAAPTAGVETSNTRGTKRHAGETLIER